MWMDHRAVEQASSITNTGHKVLSRVGGVMSPEMQPPKLLWLKEVRGERGHRRRLVSVGFCFSSYWVFRAKQGGALAYYDCNSLCLFFFSNPEAQRKLLGQSCSLFWPAWLFVLESNRFFDQVNLLSWIDAFVELIFLKKTNVCMCSPCFPRSLCTVVCKWMYCPPDGWDESFWTSIGLEDLLENNFSKIGNS